MVSVVAATAPQEVGLFNFREPLAPEAHTLRAMRMSVLSCRLLFCAVGDIVFSADVRKSMNFVIKTSVIIHGLTFGVPTSASVI
jgi:hypothetical protein